MSSKNKPSKRKKKLKNGKKCIQVIKQEMWDGKKVIIVNKVIKHNKPT